MEQSAFEAVMTGVNVFVFIIALTAAILLMTSVLDMVNFANERASVGMNGTIAQSIGIVEERTYTGAQMLTYYTKEKERAEKEQEKRYDFKIKLDEAGQEKTLEEYLQSEKLKNYSNKKFELVYKGQTNGIYEYVFTLKNET